MHRYGALVADLSLVALSPFLALLIRDNFVPYSPHWEAISGYAAISFATFCVAFLVAGSHKIVWQYTSLPDILRTTAIVTVAVVLAVSISFVESRLEGVARSVPVIQWLILISTMMGTRVSYRMWHERERDRSWTKTGTPIQHVLIVGAGPLTELYLRAVTEYGSRLIAVAGILSDRRDLAGRRLHQQEILGKPDQVLQVIDRLEVHGVIVGRVVVTQSFDELSSSAAQALLELERNSDVRVDWIVERLGLRLESTQEDAPTLDCAGSTLGNSYNGSFSPRAYDVEALSLGKYGYVKRGFDVLAALFLIVLLGPLSLVIGTLVCLDVGFPVVFWQQRPGRFGVPFKLFKFSSMGGAHDAKGNRIPDDKRSSIIGQLLRRTRLDELPQLYNILIGEMSFVGPRPLLPLDQPDDTTSRLTVRPGLTGFAQVYGGRDISAQDKNALDVWYIRNASLWLDIKILLLTTLVLIRGERVDQNILLDARQGLLRLQARLARPDSSSLVVESVTGEGQIARSRPAS